MLWRGGSPNLRPVMEGRLPSLPGTVSWRVCSPNLRYLSAPCAVFLPLQPWSTKPHVLLQHLCGPLSELYASMRVDTIPDTDNHVKVVEINLMGLSFAFNSTMLSGSCILYNYHIWFKSSCLKNILYASKLSIYCAETALPSGQP